MDSIVLSMRLGVMCSRFEIRRLSSLCKNLLEVLVTAQLKWTLSWMKIPPMFGSRCRLCSNRAQLSLLIITPPYMSGYR